MKKFFFSLLFVLAITPLLAFRGGGLGFGGGVGRGIGIGLGVGAGLAAASAFGRNAYGYYDGGYPVDYADSAVIAEPIEYTIY
jgi:hypothetical protein